MRALLIAALALATPLHAERVKDLGSFEGLRANQLTGYGIVVGLAGTVTTVTAHALKLPAYDPARIDGTELRVDAVLACREALDANVNPLLAVEAMALALRTG